MHQSSNHLKAIATLSASAALYAFLPLLIHLSGGASAPLLTNAVLSAGLTAANAVMLLTVHPRTLLHPAYRNTLRRMAISPLTAMMVITNFEFAAFALSTRFIDISITTLLYESWPVLLVAYTAWLYRAQGRYNRLSPRPLLLMAIGSAGSMLAISSHHGTLTALSQTQTLHLIYGASLGITAAALSSGAAASLRFGTIFADRLAAQKTPSRGRTSDEVIGGCSSSMLANALVIPLNVAAGLTLGERMAPEHFLLATAAAALSNGFPTILWRYGNYLTANLAINALSYISPALGVAVLVLAGATNLASPTMLAAGAVLIIAANILIAFSRNSSGQT